MKEHGEMMENEFVDAKVGGGELREGSSEEGTLKSRIAGGEIMSPENTWEKPEGTAHAKVLGRGPVWQLEEQLLFGQCRSRVRESERG